MPDGDSRGRPPARPGRLSVEVVAPPRVQATGLGTWLAAVAPAGARGAVTVAVVPDARVRRLNRDYRAKDVATDVLSFPAAAPATPTRKRVGGPGPSARGRGTPDERGMLGDIVIAEGVARRQAREAGHAFGTELRVLALHGLLHLLGYDHERDGGRMARMEQRLRLKGGLHQGLIERGTRSRP